MEYFIHDQKVHFLDEEMEVEGFIHLSTVRNAEKGLNYSVSFDKLIELMIWIKAKDLFFSHTYGVRQWRIKSYQISCGLNRLLQENSIEEIIEFVKNAYTFYQVIAFFGYVKDE